MSNIPDGFLEDAKEMRSVYLAIKYGKHISTIRAWCRNAGVRPPRLECGGRKSKKSAFDSPAQINTCLNCKDPPNCCTGNCKKVLGA